MCVLPERSLPFPLQHSSHHALHDCRHSSIKHVLRVFVSCLTGRMLSMSISRRARLWASPSTTRRGFGLKDRRLSGLLSKLPWLCNDVNFFGVGDLKQQRQPYAILEALIWTPTQPVLQGFNRNRNFVLLHDLFLVWSLSKYDLDPISCKAEQGRYWKDEATPVTTCSRDRTNV